MEKIVEQSLLFDFYGELLTNHQKEIYEEYVSENLSFSEIAEQHGISRQGVHDLIKRCNHILYGYEDKLQLLTRFLRMQKKVRMVKAGVEQYRQDGDDCHLREIEQISDEILEEL